MQSNDGQTALIRDFITLFTSFLFPIIFVVPLYIVSKGQRRADTRVVRKRMLATVLCVPTFSFIPTYIEFKRSCSADTALSDVIGFHSLDWPGVLFAVLQGAVPVIILFVGSILTLALETHKSICTQRGRIEIWIRDLLVSPVMEELCFRSGLVSYLHLRQWGPTQLIRISPLFFAVSHVHHMYDNIYNRRMSVLNSLIVAVVQCGYTYAFGCFAVFLLLASGSFVSPCVAHILCNFFGFPSFGEIRYYTNKKVISIGHVLGIVGFTAAVYYQKSHSMQYLVQATC